jgi:amidohydrolase
MLVPLLLAASLAPATPDARLRELAASLAPALVEVRRDLHRHPELGNREVRTGGLIAERLRALGLEVRHPVAKTGVLAVLKGGKPGPAVALRADIDALPVQEKNDVPYRSEVPGVKHACGHDAHTAMLLGAAEMLAKLRAELPGSVVFLFQPAEEGAPAGEEGGAALMLKEGLLDSPKVAAIYGLHVDPTLDAGQAGWASGPIFAGSDRFTLEVAGHRTHGAAPHTGLDPIPIAAELIQALQLVVSRQTDARDAKVLTIGSIHGGNRFNIVAEGVTMEGTLRTLSRATREDVIARMQRTVEGVAKAGGTTAALAFDADANPPTRNDAALTRASVPSLRRVFGDAGTLEVPPQMLAEDFALFAEKVPGFYFKLGVRNVERGIVAMNHTEEFDLDEAALPLGAHALATLAWDFLARTR